MGFPGGSTGWESACNAGGLGSIPGLGISPGDEMATYYSILAWRIPWTVAYQAPLSVGILQARILEWVAMPSSRGYSQPRDRTGFPCITGRFFTSWTTREAHDNILKSKYITLPTKVSMVKAMVFPVVMYGCESWTTKKTEFWRINAFKLWC